MKYPTKAEIEKAKQYVFDIPYDDKEYRELRDAFLRNMIRDGWRPADMAFGVLIGLKIAENRAKRKQEASDV